MASNTIISKIGGIENGIIEEHRRRILFQTDVSNEDLDSVTIRKSLSNEQLNKKQPILSMKHDWSTTSSITVDRENIKENTEKIIDFMNSLGVPSWYRGLSIFQIQAADNLLPAIRDDCAQRTVYRTMGCLESIGLDPTPTKKQMHKILPLSGGSDLALLWFLMDWLYRDNASDSYTLNEQLIMSIIAHLDMSATIRELDQILPTGPDSQTKTDLDQKKSLRRKKSKKNKTQNFEMSFPYFENLPQRKLIRRPCAIKELKPNEGWNYNPYESTDISRTMENESQRWFQNYHLKDKSSSVLNSEKRDLKKLLKKFEAATIAQNKALEIWRQKEDIKYLKKSFDIQLDVIIKKQMGDLKKIFKGKHFQKTLQKLKSRLRNDIEKCRHDFDVMTQSCLHFVTSQRDMPQSSIFSTFFSRYSLPEIEQRIRVTDSSEEMSSLSTENQISTDVKSKDFQPEMESNFFTFPDKIQYFKLDYHNIFNWGNGNGDSEDIKINPIGSWNEENLLNQYAGGKYDMIELSISESDQIKVDYGLEYYDPEDDELMDRMLKDALDIMKRNHKFVFVCLPAANRFPLLREWIRLRYGKVNRHNEVSKCFHDSIEIFKALAKLGLPVDIPSINDMGKNLLTDYSCHDYIIQKSDHIRNEFYNRIDKSLLARSRVVYSAARNCCNVSPHLNNMIFAYMPAHKRDTHNFRPWKTGESMKTKQLLPAVLLERKYGLSKKKTK